MNPRSFQFAVPLILVLLVGSCSSDEARTSDSLAEPSFACVQAISATGLTGESTVAEARDSLGALIAAPASETEADYYQALLGAIADRADTDTIGEAFDGVACTLS